LNSELAMPHWTAINIVDSNWSREFSESESSNEAKAASTDELNEENVEHTATM